MRWRDWIGARGRAAAGSDVVTDTLLLQMGQAVAIGAQGVTSLIVLRVLGPALLGSYALSSAMVALVGLLDPSGSNRVALVEVARAHGAAEPRGVVDALAGLLRASLLVKAPIVLAFFALAPWIAEMVYGQPDVGVWARWISVGLLLDIPFDMLVVVLQGRRQMPALVRAESARAILVSAASLVFLLAGWQVAGLIVARVATSGGAAVWAIAQYARRAREAPAALPSWSALSAQARTVRLASRFTLGLSMALEKNLGNLGAQMPVLMMGALRPDALGYFSAAVRAMSLPYPLVSALARNLDGLLPRRAAQGRGRLRGTFVRTTLYVGAIWALVTGAMTLAAPILLVRVGGAAYAPAVAAVLPLALQSLAVGAGVGIGAALRAIDRPMYGVGLQALSILVAAPIGYELIETFGATGGAWFHALRYALVTVAGIAIVLWLSKPAGPE